MDLNFETDQLEIKIINSIGEKFILQISIKSNIYDLKLLIKQNNIVTHSNFCFYNDDLRLKDDFELINLKNKKLYLKKNLIFKNYLNFKNEKQNFSNNNYNKEEDIYSLRIKPIFKPTPKFQNPEEKKFEENLQKLLEFGYNKINIIEALTFSNNSLEEALEKLNNY